MQELLEKLPADHFVRIHKSFAVNLARIKSLEGGQVRLENGTLLPVGRTYSAAFYQVLGENILHSRRD
jgi:DNA-binding LytR/AlgR family response regulator